MCPPPTHPSAHHHTQDEKSSLWLMGNRFIACARELLANHERIFQQTGNLEVSREWQYIIQVGGTARWGQA